MAHAELARRCVERAAATLAPSSSRQRHAEEGAESGVPGSVQSLVQAHGSAFGTPDKLAP